VVSVVANTAASVSPIYYVTFTTAVLTASCILFQGFNVTDNVKSMSLLGGFLTIFTGVYLLNFNGSDLEPLDLSQEYELAGGIGSSQTRMSLDSPRSSRDTQSTGPTRRPHSHAVAIPAYVL
jgi:hypothetical protein